METDLKFTSASITDRGLSEKRPQNEDSVLEMQPCGIFAVADGVGGAQAGDVASQMAVEILGEAFVNRDDGTDPEDVMRLAIERANTAIHQMSQDLPQLSTMATTVVALHISGNVATIGHVGDSRLYRLDNGSKIVAETADHSVVAEEVRAGRMTPEQALSHPSRNVISRAVGAESTVDIETKTIMFGPNSTFLLCSDGVTRHIDESELEGILAAGHEPVDVCNRIKELCYSRGAEDNLSAVVIRSAQAVTMPTGENEIEDDEPTVAASRSPFDDVAEPITVSNSASAGAALTPNAAEVSELDSEADYDVSSSSETHVEEPERVVALTDDGGRDVVSYVPAETLDSRADQDGSGSIFGKLLLSLAMLMVGGAIGAGAYYFWQRSNPPQPVEVPVLSEKSTNVPLTAFEESRREVDKNPEKFIAANSSQPQDAADYYLLGRAYLMSGKYWDAKQSFLKARERIATADDSDAKTLAAEIAMALAIINNGPAQEEFAHDIAAQLPASSVSNSQADNVNSAVSPNINGASTQNSNH